MSLLIGVTGVGCLLALLLTRQGRPSAGAQ